MFYKEQELGMLRTRSDSDRHRDCHLSLSESQHNQHIGVIYKDQEITYKGSGGHILGSGYKPIRIRN